MNDVFVEPTSAGQVRFVSGIQQRRRIDLESLSLRGQHRGVPGTAFLWVRGRRRRLRLGMFVGGDSQRTEVREHEFPNVALEKKEDETENSRGQHHRPANARVAVNVRHAVCREDCFGEAGLTLATQYPDAVRPTNVDPVTVSDRGAAVAARTSLEPNSISGHAHVPPEVWYG